MKKIIIFAVLIVVVVALAFALGTDKPIYDCTLEIVCDDAIASGALPAEKLELLPADGVILAKTDVKFAKGSSVMDVLQKVLPEQKIHYDVQSVAGGSKYLKGISNLYQDDCGPYSGWNYYINDEMPSESAANCKVKKGDAIRFVYVSDFTKQN